MVHRQLFAAAGVANLCYQLKSLPLTKWLLGIHAALAVAGFAMVLLAAFVTQQWLRINALATFGISLPISSKAFIFLHETFFSV